MSNTLIFYFEIVSDMKDVSDKTPANFDGVTFLRFKKKRSVRLVHFLFINRASIKIITPRLLGLYALKIINPTPYHSPGKGEIIYVSFYKMNMLLIP